MVTLHNGLAHGQTLLLKRSPILLRVVINPHNETDALDLLEDEAEEDEDIYVYKIRKNPKPSWCHLNLGRGKGGVFRVADYDIYEEQPEDKILRNNELWSKWALNEWELKLKQRYKK